MAHGYHGDDALAHELWDNALDELSDETARAIREDPFAETFYAEAMWNWQLAGDTRAEMYENFTGYMEEYFGIEWEEIFDWEAWRDAYDLG